MGRIARILERFDSFLSWWERLVPSSWNKAGVIVVTTYVFGYWAVLTQQPSVIVATCVLGAVTFMVLLFTHLPPLLQKYRSPPLTITAYPPHISPQKVTLYMFVLNTSLRSHAYIETFLHIPLSNGQEIHVTGTWSSCKTMQEGRGPQEFHSQEAYESLFIFPFPPPQDGSTFLFHNAYLRVIDHLSARSARIKIPGRFPLEDT